MKSLFIPLILIILCIAACGCTQQPAPAANLPVAPTAGGAIAELSMDKPNATFLREPGVIVVTFRAENAQKMDFSFSNISGGYGAATDLTTSGPYAGSVAFQAPAKNTYKLTISGSGQWAAKVAPLVTTAPLKAPVNLSGQGTMVSPVFSLEKGEYFFQRNETGLASPYYFLQYANGTPLMDTNNTYIQPGFSALSPHPFVFITIPESGIYYLSVLGRNNPGNWSVSILPVPVIPHMGPGPLITQSVK
jgi:hypothetical protein